MITYCSSQDEEVINVSVFAAHCEFDALSSEEDEDG
jgi:hypothetical protein